MKSFRDDSDVRAPRFGYRPEDAVRVVDYLKDKKSAYALPAELVLRCAMREDEIAGLKGENIDKEHKLLHITGKGGRFRPVPISEDLLRQLNSPSNTYSPPAHPGELVSAERFGMRQKPLELRSAECTGCELISPKINIRNFSPRK